MTSIGGGAFLGCSGLNDVYSYIETIAGVANTGAFPTSITSATLHVPAIVLEDYKTTSPWSRFGNIVPLTDDDPKPTGIEHVTATAPQRPQDVYTLTGTLVRRHAETLDGLPRGLYIVGGRKVFVK